MRRATLLVLVSTSFFLQSSVQAQTNGLTAEDRKTWYHLSQGTEFLPYDFIRALKDFTTNGMLFDSLKEFGFLDDLGSHNPRTLPVGVTVDETRDLRFAGVQMFGLNCAACHTAELKSQGKAVRIDGATAIVNVNGFSTRVGQSIQKTLTEPGEFLQFVHRVVRQKSRPLALPLVDSLHDKLITHFQELVTDDERIFTRVQVMLNERFQEKPVIDIEKVISAKTAARRLTSPVAENGRCRRKTKSPSNTTFKRSVRARSSTWTLEAVGPEPQCRLALHDC